MIEYVYNISKDSYLTPISYVSNMANILNPGEDTNLIKYADLECTKIIEKYYMDMTYFTSIRVIEAPVKNAYKIPDPILDILSKNEHLLSKYLYKSLYSVNDGEDFINSYYFSCDLLKNERLIGLDYEVDEDIKEIAYTLYVKVDQNGKFMCVGYGVDDTACTGYEWQMKEPFMAKLTKYTEEEKRRIREILDTQDVSGIEICRKQDNDVIIYVAFS